MPLNVRIDADQQRISQLVRQLHQFTNELPREVLGGMIKDVGPLLVRAAREGAPAKLPKRGGLAARVASGQFRVSPATRGLTVGIVIHALPTAVKDPGRIDRGRVRHPVFGRWTKNIEPQLQDVPKGWFTKSVRDQAPMVRKHVEKSLEEQIKRFNSGSTAA